VETVPNNTTTEVAPDNSSGADANSVDATICGTAGDTSEDNLVGDSSDNGLVGNVPEGGPVDDPHHDDPAHERTECVNFFLYHSCYLWHVLIITGGRQEL
jgi:hypothetical protein